MHLIKSDIPSPSPAKLDTAAAQEETGAMMQTGAAVASIM